MDFQLSNRIASLLVRERQGDIGDAEQKELQAWLDSSEKNRMLYERLSDEKYLDDLLTGYLAGHQDNEQWWRDIVSGHKRQHSRRRSLGFKIGGTAAVLAVGLFSLFFFGRDGDNLLSQTPESPNVLLSISGGQQIELPMDEQGTEWMKYVGENAGTVMTSDAMMLTITVPRGAEYKLLLPDSTQVWLNSETVFSYPNLFENGRRMVALNGEAYFEVAKDETKPFFVTMPDNISVMVLGTSFNLSAYQSDQQIVATLLSGAIAVETKTERVEMTPGTQAVVGPEGSVNVAAVDAAQYTMWTQGVFEFENMALSDVSQKLSRWYDVEFSFEDDTADERFTGGTWKNVPIDDFLQKIEYLNAVSFERNGRHITVRKR